MKLASTLLLTAVLLLSSCATTTKSGMVIVDAYDKDKHTVDQTATLFVPEHIRLSQINGKKVAAGIIYSGVAVRVQPGPQQVRVNYRTASLESKPSSLAINLKEPKRYFMQAHKTVKGESTYVKFLVMPCGGKEEQWAMNNRMAGIETFQPPCEATLSAEE